MSSTKTFSRKEQLQMILRLWSKAILVLRRSDEEKQGPWIDWYLGKQVGALLVTLSIRALQRADYHEYNHCIASLKAGDSNCDADCPCNLRDANDHSYLIHDVDFVMSSPEEILNRSNQQGEWDYDSIKSRLETQGG